MVSVAELCVTLLAVSVGATRVLKSKYAIWVEQVLSLKTWAP